MKLQDIQSIKGAESYCEKLIDDLLEGSIDKPEAIKRLANYSLHTVASAERILINSILEDMDGVLPEYHRECVEEYKKNLK